MKRSPRLTHGFTRTLNPKLERFTRVNPTAVELRRKKPSLGPQNGKWLKRASFIKTPKTSTEYSTHVSNIKLDHKLKRLGMPEEVRHRAELLPSLLLLRNISKSPKIPTEYPTQISKTKLGHQLKRIGMPEEVRHRPELLPSLLLLAT